jgi:hypothetical protein
MSCEGKRSLVEGAKARVTDKCTRRRMQIVMNWEIFIFVEDR